MRKFYVALAIISLFFNIKLASQSIGINTDGSTPDPTAILDIKSADKGILIPRLTTNAISNINNPAEGLLIYDSDKASFWFYQNGIWQEIQNANNTALTKSGNLIHANGGTGTEDFVIGRNQLPPAGSISDTLFFFNHQKAAFRAGSISIANWEPNKIGVNSAAFGRNPEASGFGSMAAGNYARATGIGAMAFGEDVSATGDYGTIAMGFVSGAAGDYGAIAVGYETYAIGETSVALGLEAVSNGAYSVALGQNNTADAKSSLALGSLSKALAERSSTLGLGLLSHGHSSLSVGLYNDPIVAVGAPMSATSPIFIVGNGVKNTIRSNAMVIQKDGKVGLGYDSPRELLDVNGALILGSSTSPSPVAGTIRFTGADFQGYVGGNWKSLIEEDNQVLNINGNQLSISNGNSITLPTGGSGGGDEIADADNDTKIQVEKNADEDIIRFDIEGEEKLKLSTSSNGRARLEFGANNNHNILMGADVGSNLNSISTTVAYENIFIGQQAGLETINGSNNVFLGNATGYKNIHGGYNVFIGNKAGYNVGLGSIGSSNVIIGSNAGLGSTGGSRNVFIGPYAGAVENQSDRLHIHNSQPSGPTTSLIYGQFDNKLFRINGDTELNGSLEINGAYNFPVVAGAENQILVSDASGNLSWQNIPGFNASGLPPASNVISSSSVSTGEYGSVVAIHGDQIMVGASLDNYLPNTNGSGVAHFYNLGTYDWQLEEKIGSGNTNTNTFGTSLDMDNDNLVIGARSGYDSKGRVFYFSYTPTGTTSLTDVRSSDITNGDNFGRTVALSGDYIAVSAPYKNANQGGAYIFKYDGSSLIEEEILSEPGTTRFGDNLDIDGDYLIVGAPNSTTIKAYIYHRSGTNWNLQHSVNSLGFGTGAAVSIDGDKVAISNVSPNGTSSVHILKRTGTNWSLEASITAPDAVPQTDYGISVCIAGDDLVIGAPKVDYNGNNTGAVYQFKYDGSNWNFKKKHFHPNAQPSDQIGRSVKIQGSRFVAGGSGKILIEDL